MGNNAQSNATTTDVEQLSLIQICYGDMCPETAGAVFTPAQEVEIYALYYPFWYLPNYALNIGVWLLETVQMELDSTKTRATLDYQSQVDILVGIPLGLLGAAAGGVGGAAAAVVFAYFCVLFAIGFLTFVIVAGVGTFVLVAMLTLPKSEFDVFLSSWSKAVVVGWNTFTEIDVMTVIAAEFA